LTRRSGLLEDRIFEAVALRCHLNEEPAKHFDRSPTHVAKPLPDELRRRLRAPHARIRQVALSQSRLEQTIELLLDGERRRDRLRRLEAPDRVRRVGEERPRPLLGLTQGLLRLLAEDPVIVDVDHGAHDP
jgi:hypothetical protein